MALNRIINWLFQNNFSLKKGKLLVFAFLLSIAVCSNGQIANYVNNGGFEDKYDCNWPNLLRKIKFWRGVDSLVDAVYIGNFCYGNVPNNGYAFQYPRTKSSYALTNFLCEPPACSNTNNRVYLRNRLKENLSPGIVYCVKFFINVSDNSSYGIDAIGAYFGDDNLDTITLGNIPLTYLNPQVQNPNGNILTDTMNWLPITGTFVANGNEKHMVIGNFKSDAATNKSFINSINFPNVYTNILIDDVSCIPLDLPAYAHSANDIWAIPGTTTYIGRPSDVGIDEACMWYKLPNTTTAIDTVAGFTLTVAAGTETYMVKQDICGVIKYDTVVVHASNVDIVTLSGVEGGFRVSPNPANEIINVECLMLNEGSLTIQLFNSLGQLVREEEIVFKDKTGVIKTNDLPNGIYTLNARTSNNYSINKQVVIYH